MPFEKGGVSAASEEACKLTREACAVMELLDSEERPPGFWERLRDMAAAKLPRVPDQLPPARESESRVVARAESAVFPRGRYAGTPVRDVPTDYVCWWLDESQDAFTKLLGEYSKTAAFRRRQRDEESSRPDPPAWMRDVD